MKGAFLVAEDLQLFSKVADALATIGGLTGADGEVTQFQDELGNLLTVFKNIPESTDWEWREGPFDAKAITALPDFRTATACWVECRSERAFSAMIRYLASQLPGPAWVVDGGGAVWPVSEVDPERVQL